LLIGFIGEKSMASNIVVVDDTPENLHVLVQLLQEQGYRVRPAPNGTHALATVLKEPPDLILLDIMMPEMNGYEVCRQLKADDRTRDIPVIFISALDEAIDKATAFSVGGLDYVTKPFQAEEVLARVKTHLTLRHLQQELQQNNRALASANETLEEKVQLRTAELAQANQDLQAEIEQRISHQQEKDRLFSLVSHQSEQLRTMTTWLIQTAQTERQGLASELRTEIAHKIELLQSSLTTARQLLGTPQIEHIADHLDSALQMLVQMEQYVTRITTALPRPTSHEQDISQSLLLKLTEREREVLQLLVQGKTGSEISETLSISASSVHTYNRRIKDKLNIHDIPGLVKFAIDHKLVG
jgi:DNA-binding response OmpR family regulator/DNA-binding CsgD family transcriptional regulator